MSRLLGLFAVAAIAFLCAPHPPKVEPTAALIVEEVNSTPEVTWERVQETTASDLLNSHGCYPDPEQRNRAALDEIISADRLGPPDEDLLSANWSEVLQWLLAPTGPAPFISVPVVSVDSPAESFLTLQQLFALFPSRCCATKSRFFRDNGGYESSERAVAMGLAWLAKQQKRDGSWQFDAGEWKDDRIAATGLALLAFLGAGETHKYNGKYKKVVWTGLEFLTTACNRFGSGAGKFAGTTTMTGQALATLAMCEAYGLTRDVLLRPHAQASLDYLQKLQGAGGAWPDAPGGGCDLHATGWVIQALFVGRIVPDLVVEDRVIKSAIGYLNRIANGLRKSADGTSDNTATAIELLCRHLIDGWGRERHRMTARVVELAKNPPSATNRDPLFLYYATWIVLRYEGEDWPNWNLGPEAAEGTRKGGMRDLLVGSQSRKDGPTHGSWDAEGEFGQRYGRLGTTALNVLTLEVYYRYLPLYKRGADGK